MKKREREEKNTRAYLYIIDIISFCLNKKKFRIKIKIYKCITEKREREKEKILIID